MSDIPKPAPVTSRPRVAETRTSHPHKTVGATNTPGQGSGNSAYRQTITPVGANPKGVKLTGGSSKGLSKNS